MLIGNRHSFGLKIPCGTQQWHALAFESEPCRRSISHENKSGLQTTQVVEEGKGSQPDAQVGRGHSGAILLWRTTKTFGACSVSVRNARVSRDSHQIGSATCGPTLIDSGR